MSLFLRLCIWSYVAFVRVAGLSCSTRTVDREIRLSLPSREIGTRRKLNEKKRKKKRLTEISTIFFFSFLRESRSRLERDNVIFVEKISVKIVIMRMSLKKISSRWIINLVEERVLNFACEIFLLGKFRKSDTRWKHTKTQRFFVYLKFHRCR